MTRSSSGAVLKAATLVWILGALYACGRAEVPAEDPGAPPVKEGRDGIVTGEPTHSGEVSPPAIPDTTTEAPARRPAPLKGLGEAVALRAERAGAPPATPPPVKIAVATPPAPSGRASIGADMSPSASAADSSGDFRARGGPGGFGGGAPSGLAMEPAAAPPPAPAASAPARPGSAPASPGYGVAAAESARAFGGGGGGMGALGRRAPEQRPYARVLTAGAVADVDHREAYRDYLQRHAAEAASLQLDLSRRVRFVVVDSEERPVHDATVHLSGPGGAAVGRTHADGVWDFFPSFRAPGLQGPARLHVSAGALAVASDVTVPGQGDGGTYLVRLPAPAAASPRQLDLAFLVDVTGSMGDELTYVTEEVTGIVGRVQAAVPGVQVRVAATFYRDRTDSVPIEQIPFSTDLSDFVGSMRFVRASGGGDYPEDLDSGLAAAMHTLAWNEGRAARVLVVIADAPPQRYADSQYRYADAMADASRRGIRLLPVAASGANSEVEFLFRAMGAVTSTPYVYLTDDSGIGNPHMEADSDHVSREMFSDMLTRFLIAELQGEGMHA